MQEIDKAETFVCDLTYLNSNVFFELGYAIGKKKCLLILLNSNVKGATGNYAKIEVLKGIGYSSFNNSQDILRAVEKEVDKNYVLLEQLQRLTPEEANSIEVFYIKSSTNSQAELDTIDFIKNSKYTQICDDTSEISYQPLDWYFSSLNKCKNLIVHLSAVQRTNSDIDNAKNSLYAGIGFALGKKLLLVAPKPFSAPIDYNDILIEYDCADDCVAKIKEWLQKRRPIKVKKTVEDRELNLLKLGIGCYVAEDEKDHLQEYFIETAAYKNALKSRNTIFFGRKGTGKTAIYLTLFNDFSSKEKTYVIALKPESTELLDNIKSTQVLGDLISKKTLFQIAWKHVLFSKLLVEIHTEISAQNKLEYTDLQQQIKNYYTENKAYLQKDFMNTIYDMLFDDSYKNSTSEQIIRDYTSRYLIPLQTLLKQYFHSTKYCKFVILADNLDKAWEADADLSIQAEMILSLLEVSGKFQNDLYDKDQNKIESAIVLFLRADIYNFLLKKSREPDKITVASHEVEWASCRELLKDLVEKRIKYVLELSEDSDIKEIWKDYFEFGREDAFLKVQKACLPRPRDILFFFGKMFEAACNRSHKKVNEEDYSFAFDNYTNFLYQNLIAEMSAEYPYVRDMISELHTRFKDKIELKSFRELIHKYEGDSKRIESLISELFSNDYLIAVCDGTEETYFVFKDILELEKQLAENDRWYKFKKKRIYILQHPRYARIKI